MSKKKKEKSYILYLYIQIDDTVHPRTEVYHSVVVMDERLSLSPGYSLKLLTFGDQQEVA